MNRLANILLHPICAWREHRDKRFVERIDRLYFHHDGDGNRFFKGQLHAVFDEETKMPGGLSSSAEQSLLDIQQLLSSIHPRFVGWTEYRLRKDNQSGPEEDKNTSLNHLSEI